MKRITYIGFFTTSVIMILSIAYYSIPLLVGGFFSADKVDRLIKVAFVIPFVFLAMYVCNIGANIRDNNKWHSWWVKSKS